MKRLIFSDLHLHPWNYGATTLENGFNSRIWSQWKALEEVLVYYQFSFMEIYCGGDFFHTPGSIPTQALQIANKFVEYVPDLNLLVGNHDRADKAGGIHGLDRLGSTPCLDYKFEGYEDDPSIFGLNYTEDEDELKRFFDAVAAYNEPCMALMHQGVAGVPLASGWVLDERLTPDMIPDNCHVFTGHYHFHREVSPNLTVIGNLTALNWNDIDQEKGFLVWDDETNETEFIPTHAPKFITYHPDKSVENCFVRYNEAVKPNDIPEIRKELKDQGALTVEFPVSTEEEETVKFSGSFDLNKMVEELEALEMEPRRKEIGSDVRTGAYEFPTEERNEFN
jgi:DNA repair exonuclease SbcCD nuclease subunit